MGCCGRKSRGVEARPVPKGQAVREISIRPVSPPPPVPRAQAPTPPPAPRASASSTVIQPDKTVVCKRCGSRLALKRVWSDRLRRYYNVSWCLVCQEEG